MLEQLGEYDEDCNPGEDADLCVRAARAGWAQYFERSAYVHHEARHDLKALIRQWIWYARGSSPFFFKLQSQRLEVYLDWELTPKMYQYRRVLAARRFPVPAMLFISPFPVLNCSALGAIIAAAAGVPIAAFILGLLTLLCVLSLFKKSPLRRLAAKDVAVYSVMAYVINLTCMLASIYAGLRKGRVFFYPGI